MGAGDGSSTIRTARADAGTLAIALDASTDALARGARVAARRRLRNALFVVSAVEQLHALDGIADVVTVNFPWGSLLRGIVCAEDAVLRPLARLPKPGAAIRVLLSIEDRDRSMAGLSADPGSLLRNAERYRCAGLTIAACATATSAEISESGSSWAKRLAAGRARAVTALTLRRDGPIGGGSLSLRADDAPVTAVRETALAEIDRRPSP